MHGPGVRPADRAQGAVATGWTGRSRSPTTAIGGLRRDRHGPRDLAAALEDEEFDLVIMGNQSTDARSMLVPGDARGVPRGAGADLRQAPGGRDDAGGGPPRDTRRATRRWSPPCRRWSAWSRRSTSRATPRSRGSWRPRRSRWTPRPRRARAGRPTSGGQRRARSWTESSRAAQGGRDKVEDDGSGRSARRRWPTSWSARSSSRRPDVRDVRRNTHG